MIHLFKEISFMCNTVKLLNALHTDVRHIRAAGTPCHLHAWWSWLFFHYKYQAAEQKSALGFLFRASCDESSRRKINLQTTSMMAWERQSFNLRAHAKGSCVWGVRNEGTGAWMRVGEERMEAGEWGFNCDGHSQGNWESHWFVNGDHKSSLDLSNSRGQ